jgi:hypothetical protein
MNSFILASGSTPAVTAVSRAVLRWSSRASCTSFCAVRISHSRSGGVPRQDGSSVDWLWKNHGELVLKLIAYGLPVVLGANVLHYLFP